MDFLQKSQTVVIKSVKIWKTRKDRGIVTGDNSTDIETKFDVKSSVDSIAQTGYM